jgi:hypothetical protein
MKSKLLAALAAMAFLTPVAAAAQEYPSYAQPAPQDEQIHGRIISFDGGYNLQVRDDRGFIDNVELHQGTIINPTGLTLASGMIVSILGYNAGGFFAANEIDTPYTFYYGQPYYAGHPWYYYGPSVGLGFFFGNTGWWQGGYYGHDYDGDRGYHGYGGNDGRGYVSAPPVVRNVYPERGNYHDGAQRGYVERSAPVQRAYVQRAAPRPVPQRANGGGGRPH